ncbi:MAG TPA: 2-oxo-4-hydroxy-4-carboxy-5-ureidoimidazoline decarboxylase [Thermoanaerobaculia bacterium]|nr:2-oxo-4-hydroxy-4-carboxy-5-ureidoimidazoline decarboxylase [Thermoanaerobaculia bacterium]
MIGGLDRLNALPREHAETQLLECCGSRQWARRLAAERPFASADDLADAADRIWRSLPADDWLEAFAAHPRIGQSSSNARARREQAGTKSASPETLASLADVNREYEERFGHIFIVCATGKSAAEMLALAESRLHNDPQTELAIAAEEQRKIMRLRLAKLLEAEGA